MDFLRSWRHDSTAGRRVCFSPKVNLKLHFPFINVSAVHSLSADTEGSTKLYKTELLLSTLF